MLDAYLPAFLSVIYANDLPKDAIGWSRRRFVVPANPRARRIERCRKAEIEPGMLAPATLSRQRPGGSARRYLNRRSKKNDDQRIDLGSRRDGRRLKDLRGAVCTLRDAGRVGPQLRLRLSPVVRQRLPGTVDVDAQSVDVCAAAQSVERGSGRRTGQTARPDRGRRCPPGTQAELQTLAAEAEAAYEYLRNTPAKDKAEARKDWIRARDNLERARIKAARELRR